MQTKLNAASFLKRALTLPDVKQLESETESSLRRVESNVHEFTLQRLFDLEIRAETCGAARGLPPPRLSEDFTNNRLNQSDRI